MYFRHATVGADSKYVILVSEKQRSKDLLTTFTLPCLPLLALGVFHSRTSSWSSSQTPKTDREEMVASMVSMSLLRGVKRSCVP